MAVGRSEETEGHGGSTLMYLGVWAVLVFFTVLSFTAMRGMEGALGVAAPLAVASVKAMLVILFFMHLRYEGWLIRLVFMILLATMFILFILMWTDFGYRPGGY